MSIEAFSSVSRLKLPSVIVVSTSRKGLIAAAALLYFLSLPAIAQKSDPETPPIVVQPGAPGQPTLIRASSTRAKLPPRSMKDAEFMQGMIMHHAQAVEMTALIESRTLNKDIRLLGARISQSQSDEMKFMKRWLEARGEPISPPMAMASDKTEMPSHHHHSLMPGMLSQKQMEDLRQSKGKEFDDLFLSGMIQHHKGALAMVKEMFDTAGAGQDAELFNFATDVDSGQRAEIRILETLLSKNR